MPDDVLSTHRLSTLALEVSRAVESAIIWYPGFADIRDHALRLASRTGEHKLPGGFVLSGASGMGKDTLIGSLRSILTPPEVLSGSSRPLLVIETPSMPNEGALISELLEALAYPFADCGEQSIKDRTKRLVKALRACRVKLILFNEFQHTVENDRRKLGKALTDSMKLLYEKTGVAMCFFGTEAIERIDAINDQFATRFSGRYRLRPFALDASFQGVLKGFETSMTHFEPAGIWKDPFVRPVHAACGGVMRLVKELLTEAVIVAVNVGAKKLTLEHFAEAYQQKRGQGNWSGASSNPFLRH